MARLSQKVIQERIANKQLKIKLLTKAKKHLNDNHARGVCIALEKSVTGSYYNNPQWNAVDELQTYIMGVLGHCSYYTTWARCKSKKVDNLYYDDDYKFSKQAKVARKAWIDWMINCLTEDIDKLKGKLK